VDSPIGWYASISGMIAAIVIAADLGRRATGWAFVLFVTSAIAWITAGMLDGEASLLWQNVVLLITNLFGVYRWLIRKQPP
jgi:hypothetical protein